MSANAWYNSTILSVVMAIAAVGLLNASAWWIAGALLYATVVITVIDGEDMW